MGFDFLSLGIGIAIGAGGYWAYDNGYITLPPIVLPPLPCASGQYRNTVSGNCEAEPVCITGQHIDTAVMPHVCVADTPASYARAFLARRGYYG